MNGAESVLRTLCGAGVKVCFANPGTSEIHLVAALDRVPDMRAVLVLFEGVASAAADGYARMTGAPAATLFHLGPGLGNAIANLHNARRAAAPLVNIIGDHPGFHLPHDAPLTSDIESLARPVSGWIARAPDAARAAASAARAVRAACEPPGQIASLILPADAAWGEAEGPAPPLPRPAPAPVAPAAIERAARALKAAKKPAILLRGASLRAAALEHAGRIAAATGAQLFCDTFAPRIERGRGRVAAARIPYFPEQVLETLAPFDCLLLAGTRAPVSFFAYPGLPSSLLPEGTACVTLCHPHEDGARALSELAAHLKAPKEPAGRVSAAPAAPPKAGGLTPESIAQSLAACLPEGAIVCDESATSGLALYGALASAPAHDLLALTGGAIGQGLPLAVGASVACPERKVICLHGDGGAMYTLQSLWTQAREKLDVLTVIFSNRAYRILQFELARAGAANPGPGPLALFDLGNPDLDWAQLAGGMGVEASRAHSAEEFHAQLTDAMRRTGPRLIEAIV